MSAFMSNFNIFFTSCLSSLASLWSWFISTILGQIFVFTIIISLFILIIYKLIHLGE